MQDDGKRPAHYVVTIYLRPAKNSPEAKRGQVHALSEYWNCHTEAAVRALVSKSLRRARCTGMNIVRHRDGQDGDL